MSTTEQKETKLEISLPQGGFPKVMYFNRFRVDRDPEFKLVQFGLIVDTDLVDGYSSILPNDALKQNEKSLLDYLNRIGRPAENADGSWKGLTGECHASVADIITMAHRGGVAETGLFIFSLSAATRLHKAGAANETILAQPLVLLRSSAELQKQLIQSLYAE